MDSHQVEGQERCAFDIVIGLPWVKVVIDRMRHPAHRVHRASGWPHGLLAVETVVLATNRSAVLALGANALRSR
jgi:hypothetical protein